MVKSLLEDACWRTYATLLCCSWVAISLQELVPQVARL